MQQRPSSAPSAHRLARFIAWLGAVLAWLALGAPCFTAAQRRHRQRYGHLDAGALTRALRNLVIIQAAQFFSDRNSTRRYRFRPPAGVRRDARKQTLRAVGGAWLRRKLRVRGGLLKVVLHLIEALRHLRGLGARLAWRLRRGMTRLAPLIIATPRTQAVADVYARAVALADSS